MHLGYLQKNLEIFQVLNDLEVLFIDGGSTDGTREFLERHRQRVLLAPDTSRAHKFQRGMDETAHPMILFHHPRSQLSADAIESLKSLSDQVIWGGFRHKFDQRHWALQWTSWYSNTVRSRRGILYLDHCLFAHRVLMDKIGGFPQYDIFEDTILCTRLRCYAAPVLLPFTAKTSAVRFQRNGLIFQILMNQLLKCGHYLGVSDQKLNKFYERGLELNQKYGQRIRP